MGNQRRHRQKTYLVIVLFWSDTSNTLCTEYQSVGASCTQRRNHQQQLTTTFLCCFLTRHPDTSSYLYPAEDRSFAEDFQFQCMRRILHTEKWNHRAESILLVRRDLWPPQIHVHRCCYCQRQMRKEYEQVGWWGKHQPRATHYSSKVSILLWQQLRTDKDASFVQRPSTKQKQKLQEKTAAAPARCFANTKVRQHFSVKRTRKSEFLTVPTANSWVQCTMLRRRRKEDLRTCNFSKRHLTLLKQLLCFLLGLW